MYKRQNQPYSPDCVGGFLDADGCQAGECLGNDNCECQLGWRKTKGSCNLCDWGFAFSYEHWACVEEGSSCTTEDCSEAMCAPACSDSIRGDGICQERCNTAACGFDDGDCVGDLGWASTFCHVSWIGDGVCDVACEKEVAGGDCKDGVCDCADVCYHDDARRSRRLSAASARPPPPRALAAAAAVDPISGAPLAAPKKRPPPGQPDYAGLVSIMSPDAA